MTYVTSSICFHKLLWDFIVALWLYMYLLYICTTYFEYNLKSVITFGVLLHSAPINVILYVTWSDGSLFLYPSLG